MRQLRKPASLQYNAASDRPHEAYDRARLPGLPLLSSSARWRSSAAFGEEEREAIAARMEPRRYRGGEIVFREGEASDGLYVVATGEVRV